MDGGVCSRVDSRHSGQRFGQCMQATISYRHLTSRSHSELKRAMHIWRQQSCAGDCTGKMMFIWKSI